jgi:hypothetical protein
MITAKYHLCDHSTLRIVHESTKTFVNESEKKKYENSFSGHPVYYLVEVKEEQKQ